MLISYHLLGLQMSFHQMGIGLYNHLPARVNTYAQPMPLKHIVAAYVVYLLINSAVSRLFCKINMYLPHICMFKRKNRSRTKQKYIKRLLHYSNYSSIFLRVKLKISFCKHVASQQLKLHT